MDEETSIFNAFPPRLRGSRIQRVSKVEVVEKPKSKGSKEKYRMSEVEYVLDVDVRIEETKVQGIKESIRLQI